MIRIVDNGCFKLCQAKGYNYSFHKHTGDFIRWGDTFDSADDPEMAPGPEILDIEIATACDGVDGVPCRFCYKANKPLGSRMSFETFERVFCALPATTCQIAFGIGNLYGHDDMWRIFQHARDNEVIPNVTINGWGLTDEIADKLVAVMGAVAVSRYDPDTCYDAVKKLTDRGLVQCNIHALVSTETYEDCMQLLQDVQTDPRLSELNAVVFLMLKPKGRGVNLTPLKDATRYKALVDYALSNNLRVGFDSCSVPSFLNATKGHPKHAQFTQDTDRCESGLFSLYVDVRGVAWPCSFGQGTPGVEGVDLLAVKDFTTEVWWGPALEAWRARLRKSCRSCPLWAIDIGSA